MRIQYFEQFITFRECGCVLTLTGNFVLFFPQYGTAWKKDATADLVAKAIRAGFRHIDTACQPRHYNEAGVGDGWVAAARELNLDRTDIWLQTKFSGINAHDPDNVPYDVNASLEDRVRQSLQKSLENLKTDYIDSWIMHGPEDNWDDHWKVSIYLHSDGCFFCYLRSSTTNFYF